MEMPDAQRWPLLERLAEGSVRRALQLAGSGGLELYERIEAPARRAAAGRLAGGAYARRPALARPPTSSASRPSTTCCSTCWRGWCARGQRGAAAPSELALAQRLIPEARLPAWAALWEGILSERADAALLNLDKRALILGTFAKLEALARVSTWATLRVQTGGGIARRTSLKTPNCN